MAAVIRWPGLAETIAVETRAGRRAAALEFGAEDIFGAAAEIFWVSHGDFQYIAGTLLKYSSSIDAPLRFLQKFGAGRSGCFKGLGEGGPLLHFNLANHLVKLRSVLVKCL